MGFGPHSCEVPYVHTQRSTRFFALPGVALYSAHGDFDKTKGLLDKLLPTLTGLIACALGFLLRLEVLQRLDANSIHARRLPALAGISISQPDGLRPQIARSPSPNPAALPGKFL